MIEANSRASSPITQTFPKVCIKSSSPPLATPLGVGGAGEAEALGGTGGADILAFLLTAPAASVSTFAGFCAGGGATVGLAGAVVFTAHWVASFGMHAFGAGGGDGATAFGITGQACTFGSEAAGGSNTGKAIGMAGLGSASGTGEGGPGG